MQHIKHTVIRVKELGTRKWGYNTINPSTYYRIPKTKVLSSPQYAALSGGHSPPVS
jgi:hypothetical protein